MKTGMKIAAAMTALALLLFPLGAWMIVSRAFDLTMERERSRALSEEAAIARAVAMEIGHADAQELYAAASGLQGRYGSKTLSVYLIYGRHAMGGAQLPEAEGMEGLLAAQGRATLLDGESQSLLIAHRLNAYIMLLIKSDVSGVYALRRELSLWAGMLCTAGVALCALLSVLAAHRLAQPFRLLAQQRQELIDALAHEMRTPLTAIVAGSRMLQQAKLAPERQSMLLDTMAREAKRLSDMDERLLQLTRLEHEKLTKTAFSSREMALEALSVFENVQLSGEDAQFIAERELTIQLLRNLVVNAVRAGGHAPVRVELNPDGFSVADQGCGMTKEQIARAFEPFYKADKSRTRETGGAGLGLALCRKIAALHGGRLEIDSEVSRGTTVCYKFDTTMRGH
ncbi:MAG: HAMP domain-containing histidine kinase [Clostridia bacterium]|nr:HAMP domain-containing histidine kinase [Clostridia bacterium]